MIEIDARQVAIHFTAFDVDVIAHRRHVRIDANDGKRPGVGRRIEPTELRAEVLAQADMRLIVRDTEGEFAGNRLIVADALAVQLHRLSPCDRLGEGWLYRPWSH